MKAEDFFSLWSGIAVFATNSLSKSKKKEFIRNYQNDNLHSKMLSWTIIFLSGIYLLRLSHPLTEIINGTLEYNIDILHYLTKPAGLFFCFLLITHERGVSSLLISRLCHIGRLADCNAVTSSKISTLYGSITLADAGFAYFGGAVLTFLIMPFDTVISVIRLISIALVPIPVFLILYQVFKVRRWCPLCLGVQMVIMAEAILSILSYGEMSNLLETSLVLTVSTVLVLLLVFFTNRHYHLKELYLKEKVKAIRLKRDPIILEALLLKEDPIIPENHPYNLAFGNREGSIHITLFLSFHCRSCSKTWEQFREFFAKHQDFYVHLIPVTEKEDRGLNLLKNAWFWHQMSDSEKALLALDEVFGNDQSEQRGSKSQHSTEEDYSGFLQYNNQLCEEMGITKVPFILVNGYRLPAGYGLKDIEYYCEYKKEDKSALKFPMQRKEVLMT